MPADTPPRFTEGGGVPRPEPLTLAIDASTYEGSVALAQGATVLAELSVAMRGEREERLMPATAAVMKEAGIATADLGRIVCGAGPGSFTSLRIAASIAKGLAQGGGVPLLAVSSLTLIVAASRRPLAAGRYLAALDAMRGERYVALVGVSGNGAIEEVTPVAIVPVAELEALAARESATLVGPGWVLPGHETALVPRAAGVARLALSPALLREVPLSTWEPSYGRLAEAQVKWEAAHGRSLTIERP